MKRLVWLLALFIACEGPEGPTGPEGPQGPPGDGREIVWLYPEDEIYRVVDSTSAYVQIYVYFNINIIEFRDRRGGPIFAYVNHIEDGAKWYSALNPITIDDEVNIYYHKLGFRLTEYFPSFYYVYFCWDAETP